MNSQNFSELARQGDSNAIALLINQRLKPKGVTAEVDHKGSCLKISLYFDGKRPVAKENLLNFIENGVRKLEIPGIESIDISGFESGKEHPTWSQKQKIGILPKQHPEEASQNLPKDDSQDGFVNEAPKAQQEFSLGGCLIDLVILLFSLIIGFYTGIYLSSIPGEYAPDALRAVLGIMGLFLPLIIILILGKNRHWKRIRLAIIAILMISASIFYADFRESVQEQPIAQDPEVEESILISQRAAQLRIGMTYGEVIDLLGRMPDTVVNDQILQELGEPIYGNNLISFEWRNDNPNCGAVAVDFNSSTMTVTGWDQGKLCTGPSTFNEPFGKACSETTLCQN